MNNLKDIKLRNNYDPSIDGSDVINDFYIPCLSVAKKYDRLSAYFTSSILKKYSLGLEKFVKNDGHIRFIFSCQITQSELDNIENAYKLKMDGLVNVLDSSVDYSYEVANLSYLISKGIAEVKIAFMISTKSSLMHMKSGLFEDYQGNTVYFDGSGNETEAGLLRNAEIFNVFTSFAGGESWVNIGKKRFEDIWNNKYSKDIIRTEYPYGNLFEKLKSYNRGLVFDSQVELYKYENCVTIDISRENNCIILNDYTKEKYLNYPMILKNRIKNFACVRDDEYLVNELNLTTLKMIIKVFDSFNIKCILSMNSQIYIEENDLELEKRVKLGLSIKNDENKDLWYEKYLKFKFIVDSEMTAKLKDSQMKNAFFHYCMKSSMDFSVPGTGKTYITYGMYSYLTSQRNPNKNIDSLVVFGPLNCFKAWKEEAINIFGNKRDFAIFDITEHHNDFKKYLLNSKFDIYLFNFDFINEEKIKIFNNIINDKTMVVFDEIHKLKSISGKRANLFIDLFSTLKSKPIYKLALTGTPIPNSFVDIYNCLKILYNDDMNSVLSSISVNMLKLADNSIIKEEEIQNKLAPLFVRTTKNDLKIPLPEPDDKSTLLVNPSEKENKLFEFIFKYSKNPLVKFIRLIQASSNPKLLKNKINIMEINQLYDDNYEDNPFDDMDLSETYDIDVNTIVNDIGLSSKMKKTIELIKSITNHNEKVIVWCLFIDTIDTLSSELSKLGIDCISISGRDNVEIRNKRIDKFKYESVKVLITNPNTLAESVSLHRACHNAIYLEYGFNLTYLLQSKDRIHRVGLPENTKTKYYFAICKNDGIIGSIDELIYDRLELKANRMIRTIESNNLVLSHNSSDIEDIKEILEKIR